MRAAKGAASNGHAASYARVAWPRNVATDYSGASTPNVSRDTISVGIAQMHRSELRRGSDPPSAWDPRVSRPVRGAAEEGK